MNENIIDSIKEAINGMDSYEVVSIWNEYCEETNRFDDKIEDMDSISGLFDMNDIHNLLNRFYFGYDAMNGKDSSANPNREWFILNGYGNIVSTDYPMDFIDVDELVEYIVDNNDALYNDDIQSILYDIEEEEVEN